MRARARALNLVWCCAQEEASGEDFNVEAVEDGPRPFSCLLDTGLKRTTTGSKVFAALKVRARFPCRSLASCPAQPSSPCTLHAEPPRRRLAGALLSAGHLHDGWGLAWLFRACHH